MKWKRGFVAAAVACVTPIAMMAQDANDTRPTLAVLPFTNGAIQPELAPLSKGFQAMMLTQLGSNQRIRLVERENLQRILDELSLGNRGQLDQQTMSRVGHMLGAKYMIYGSYITDPRQNMTITVTAFEVETSRIIYTDGSTRGKVDDLMDLVVRASNTASSRLDLPQLPARSPDPAPGAAPSQAPAKKAPVEALLLYSRAVTEQDKGNTKEAVELYRLAVDRFPSYQPARDALRQLEQKPR
jgi:TolB-like protein